MLVIIAVIVGGAIGGSARYTISGALDRRSAGRFPWGTLVVNIGGSFLLGVVLSVETIVMQSTEPRAFLAAGILGAFTTFSTYSRELVEMVEKPDLRRQAGIYAVGSVALGLIAVVSGTLFGELITTIITSSG